MSVYMIRRLLFVVVAMLIVGCSVTVTPTPTRPALSPQPVSGVIETPSARTTIAPNIPLATTSPRPRPTVAVRSGGVQKDVTYCTVNGVALKMDVYSPANATGSLPAIVFVHGGGWRGGDKNSGEVAYDLPVLVAHGYLVASVNYRLAPKYKWPAMIEDVKCAIRSLRANAAVYNLDPKRIAAMGASAGGQLVAMAGLADTSAGFDVGEYGDQSSRVQAVVDLYGPTRLNAPDYDATHLPVIIPEVFGVTAANAPVLVQASPVTYVTRDAPPFLIMHGDKDTTVPPNQSQLLYDKLHTAGADVTLVMVKNAGHGFGAVGGTINPSRAEITQIMLQFLDKHLKQ